MENVIESERLVMRRWRDEDAAELFSLASDPAVGVAAGWPPHTSEEFSLYVIRNYFSAPETYAVVLKETGRIVGCCGIVPAEMMTERGLDCRDSEIGYWIGRPFWGRGLAPEAVRALMRRNDDVVRWWIAFFVGNDKSRRVAEKCDFKYHHTSGTGECKEAFYLFEKK